MRVLHCIYDDPANPWVGGGGAMRVLDIYRRLADRIDATVATGAYPGALDETRDGVRYIRLGASTPYALSRATYAHRASALLARGEYDAAIFDFSVYTPITVPPHRPVGVVVHMLHGDSARDRWGGLLGGAVGALERRALWKARRLSTPSAWMEGRLAPLLSPGATLTRVGSGIPEEFGRVARQERGYLLYYGRFDVFHKGLDVLLEAFARISAVRPDLELRIAGRGRDAAQVRERAAVFGSRVQVLEGVTRDAVLRLFSGAMAMLMPSRLEGLAMAPAEAMAAGVPVIASDVGALPEVLDPPLGGVLVPPGDAAALADATLALVGDDARREALSHSARRSAARFSWDAVAEQHLTFLHQVAGHAGHASSDRLR